MSSSIDVIFDMIKQFEDIDKGIRATIKEYLGSNENSFEDKWKLFSSVNSDLLPHDKWSLDFDELQKHDLCWVSDFHVERREIVDLVDIVDRLECDKKYNFVSKKSNIDIEQFKREILKQGYRTFVFDW